MSNYEAVLEEGGDKRAGGEKNDLLTNSVGPRQQSISLVLHLENTNKDFV